jgi:hypothetical protein
MRDSSHVVAKHPCPQCRKTGSDRSGDNLAEYSDGHFYCFKCGHYIHSTTSQKIYNYESIKQASVGCVTSDFALPSDVSLATSGLGYSWLCTYSITASEIISNRIMWSEERLLLCYPLLINQEVVAWQARNFNPEKKYKYLTKGNVQDNIFSFGSGDTCILVEDIVSAIKVSRHGVVGIAVLGSVIKPSLLQRLNKFHSKQLIWLDPDKQMDACKYAATGRSLGISCFTILSEKDPKAHDDDYIKDKINEYN